jgi:hypothetical protein
MKHVLTRVQRSRAKGSKIPPKTLCCTRPSEWSNPFKPISKHPDALAQCLEDYGVYLDVRLHLGSLELVELCQYDYLACWCPLDGKCHVDLILERWRMIDFTDDLESRATVEKMWAEARAHAPRPRRPSKLRVLVDAGLV